MTTEKIMTMREMLTAIINGEVTDEVIARAEMEIAKMNKANEKRRNAEKKPNAEVEERRAKVLEVLQGAEAPMTRDELAAAAGISPAQVSGAVKGIDGVIRNEVKVEGAKSKKVVYSFAK